MVEFAVEFWWNMLLSIFQQKKLENHLPNFAGNSPPIFAETFANFTLEVAGA